MLRELDFKIDLHNTTWHFTPKARLTIWKLGAANLEEVRVFAGRLLAVHKLREGETEINLRGEGLRITKQDSAYRVEHLEETW